MAGAASPSASLKRSGAPASEICASTSQTARASGSSGSSASPLRPAESSAPACCSAWALAPRRARGVGELIDVGGARDAQPVAVRRGRERRLARRLERAAQLGPVVAAQRECALGGLRDLGGVGHERGLLGRLAERGEHRRLLHAARVGEREPVAVDCDPAELGDLVLVFLVVLRREPRARTGTRARGRTDRPRARPRPPRPAAANGFAATAAASS